MANIKCLAHLLSCIKDYLNPFENDYKEEYYLLLYEIFTSEVESCDDRIETPDMVDMEVSFYVRNILIGNAVPIKEKRMNEAYYITAVRMDIISIACAIAMENFQKESKEKNRLRAISLACLMILAEKYHLNLDIYKELNEQAKQYMSITTKCQNSALKMEIYEDIYEKAKKLKEKYTVGIGKKKDKSPQTTNNNLKPKDEE